MSNPTEATATEWMPYIEVCIDPDGVNGYVEVLGNYDGPEIRVIVTRGPDHEVIHDTHPDAEPSFDEEA